jgi:hypothetical protein
MAAIDKNGFLIDLSESDRVAFGQMAFSQQSEPQKVFSAVWALESQVNNGGFAQYFASSDGDTADFAPRALRTIGAIACANVVERALRTVSATPLPGTQDARESLVDSISEEARDGLKELDREFSTYPDNLTELLFAFVAKNPKEFGAIPQDGDA